MAVRAARERTFCAHGLTYAYCFSRHSYSAFRADVVSPGWAGQSRSVIAATIPVAESNAVTPWSYATAKVLPLGENRTA